MSQPQLLVALKVYLSVAKLRERECLGFEREELVRPENWKIIYHYRCSYSYFMSIEYKRQYKSKKL